MTYYGIVDKIQHKHKSGVYGRRKLTEEESKELEYVLRNTGFKGLRWDDFIPFWTWVKLVWRIPLFYKLRKLQNIEKEEISLQHQNEQNILSKRIVISNNILNDYYKLKKDIDLIYGLFDNFTFKDIAFEKIMKSKGGSELIILERNSLPKNINHFGGKNGRFSYGIYCSHPKDENQIIPLENSNELIKNLILEETLSAYEALGAMRIVIEDRTTFDGNIGGTGKGVKIDINGNYLKEILREKNFGKGTFDPERALKDKFFIHDFPNIKTTLTGRINGNQTSEKFTETVNLNAGLDVDVLSLYKANANFEYTRKWYFEVEFYDKNQL